MDTREATLRHRAGRVPRHLRAASGGRVVRLPELPGGEVEAGQAGQRHMDGALLRVLPRRVPRHFPRPRRGGAGPRWARAEITRPHEYAHAHAHARTGVGPKRSPPSHRSRLPVRVVGHHERHCGNFSRKSAIVRRSAATSGRTWGARRTRREKPASAPSLSGLLLLSASGRRAPVDPRAADDPLVAWLGGRAPGRSRAPRPPPSSSPSPPPSPSPERLPHGPVRPRQGQRQARRGVR